jgi:very-short-patch-repair endonuclease
MRSIPNDRKFDFRFHCSGAPRTGMRELFELMAAQHGVATTSQARALGLSRRAEVRMIARGILSSPARDVLAASGAPVSFEGRAMAAVLSPGVTAVSHGAAARLHGLDGFDRYDRVDVIGCQGANPHPAPATVIHYTRGPILDHVVAVDQIPVMSVASTLALLAPGVGVGPTARALDSALRMGVSADELRTVALTWRRRGRRGPPALLMLLGERVDNRLPRSWFQRVAARVLAAAGIRLVDEYPVRDRRGILLAELDLAEPVRKVGVECQSWQWYANPTAQHRDARRKGTLRQLGWEVVDVWWSDVRNPDRVISEVLYLLRSRDPTCRLGSTGSSRFQTTERR